MYRMAACHVLSLCCQGTVFVTLVVKLWVKDFAAQSTVVAVLCCGLATLSSGMVLQKRIGFYRGGEEDNALLM